MTYTNGTTKVSLIRTYKKAVGTAIVEHVEFKRDNGTKFELPKLEWERKLINKEYWLI